MIQTLWPSSRRVVIGMLHAPPLPGSPRFAGGFDAVRDAVLRDAAAWTAGGAHGLMLENFGDVPFFKGRVPPETVAALTALALAVRGATDLPLGINVLRNDAESALAVALAGGAQFIRVNILAGAAVTDQGVIEGDAANLMRRRRAMGAEHLHVLADVRVKHAAPLGPAWRPLAEEIEDLIYRAGAAGVIVTGAGTGKPTDPAQLADARAAAGNTPVFVGSGATPDTAAQLLRHADGLIVGTYAKRQGQPGQPVDPTRVQALINALHL